VKVKAGQTVHTRTASGRTWSVMEGTTANIDDKDTDLIAAVHELAKAGMVEVIKEAKDQPDDDDDEPDAPDDTEPAEHDNVKAATVKPSATTKPSTASRSTGRR
jgi:hypothetical protein